MQTQLRPTHNRVMLEQDGPIESGPKGGGVKSSALNLLNRQRDTVA